MRTLINFEEAGSFDSNNIDLEKSNEGNKKLLMNKKIFERLRFSDSAPL